MKTIIIMQTKEYIWLRDKCNPGFEDWEIDYEVDRRLPFEAPLVEPNKVIKTGWRMRICGWVPIPVSNSYWELMFG